jgi:hypothetical protein
MERCTGILSSVLRQSEELACASGHIRPRDRQQPERRAYTPPCHLGLTPEERPTWRDSDHGVPILIIPPIRG